MAIDFPKTAQGVAKLATPDDVQQDVHGLTNPNLHRRVDAQQPQPGSSELAPREYTFGIYDGIHSYKTTQITTHDEESTTSEIP